MNRMQDTIAAQATAAGEGGVAVVRMSGSACTEIVARIFRAKNGKPLAHRIMTYGYVVDHNMIVDEAMAVLMRAPNSYTREDVIEIQCHGSQMLVRRILMLLMANGARMAEPGEFTYRAFVNGRIDLSQAEGVMRMIRAGSERALKGAIRQLEGGVAAFVKEARGEIITLLAALSAATDFPDEIEESETAQEIERQCGLIRGRLKAACDERSGRIEEEGMHVVLCGKPNAGKSSLLNALLGGERAIVTDVPGTTRDTLTEFIQIEGIRVCLTDTAGLRETGDIVERIGVERARKAMDEADVLVLVVDASQPYSADDALLGDMKPQLIVLNKGDLPACAKREDVLHYGDSVSVVTVCATSGEGMDTFRRELMKYAPEDSSETNALTQVRHVEAAARACSALTDAMNAIAQDMPLDVVSIDLSSALDALGEITGETMNEKVISEVFAKFCVGK